MIVKQNFDFMLSLSTTSSGDVCESLRAIKYITSGSCSKVGDVMGMIEKSLSSPDLRHYHSITLLYGII